MSGMKEFTATARIGRKEARELIEYQKQFAPVYQRAFRTLWQRVNREGIGILAFRNRAKINTEMQETYSFSKRTANSLINDVLGRFRALAELKKYERTELCWKIASNEKKREALREKAEALKPKVAENKATARELSRYRQAKKKIFSLGMKINRQRNRLKALDKQIEANRFSMCLGSKKFFKAQYHLEENGLQSHKDWLEKFRKRRDAGTFFLGSAEETASNQEFQLMPSGKNDGWFDFKCRVSNATPLGQAGKKYVEGRIKFSQKEYADYLADNLSRTRALRPKELDELSSELREKEILESSEKRISISYRIFSRGRKYYVTASFKYSLRGKENDYLTDARNGVVGLDFNSGHIQLSETNETGNLVHLQKFPLLREGTKMETDVREAIAHIVKYCLSQKKPLAIENLDFTKKKSKTQPAESGAGKGYNRMIHSLNYSEFSECAENATYRNRVELIKVNPAYTTKIAKQKYCNQRKLVTHQGAAFVIARRVQGFVDKYIEPEEQEA